jgi:hypothetical protein
MRIRARSLKISRRKRVSSRKKLSSRRKVRHSLNNKKDKVAIKALETNIRQSYFFDQMTALLYLDNTNKLTEQLCSGYEPLSILILTKELDNLIERGSARRRAYKKNYDLGLMCDEITENLVYKGLLDRFLGGVWGGLKNMYHTLFKVISSSHFIYSLKKKIVNNNYNSIFQYLFFVHTQYIKSTDFIRLCQREYYEFPLVKGHQELSAIKESYSTDLKLLSDITRNKSFNLSDIFTGRNPSYFIQNVGRDAIYNVIKQLQDKISKIISKCNFLMKEIAKTKDFIKEEREYEVVMRKRREEERRVREEMRRHRELQIQEETLQMKREKNTRMAVDTTLNVYKAFASPRRR